MRISSAIIAAGFVAGLSMAASAQTDGLYVGAEAGVNFVPTLKFNAENNIWKQQQDPGYAVLGQVGYGFGNVRLEGEVGWRSNGLKKFSDNFGDHSVDGSVRGAGSVMGNVYYDFHNDSPFTPYIGVGVGGVNVSENNVKVDGTQLTDDSNFVLAYQGIAGVSYAIDQQLSLRADYRYLRSEQATVGLTDAFGGNYAHGRYEAHTVAVGFVWHFNTPAPAPVVQQAAVVAPPAPPPAPAPAPKPVQAAPIPKNFMIFFDFDKSDLTPAAQSILTQAADAFKKQGSASVALTGYTDTVGSAEYNLKLSVRRAESAKKFLVAQGIPANEISTVGKGKTDLLVPTKDGVREAQNRRVQIVLQ